MSDTMKIRPTAYVALELELDVPCTVYHEKEYDDGEIVGHTWAEKDEDAAERVIREAVSEIISDHKSLKLYSIDEIEYE